MLVAASESWEPGPLFMSSASHLELPAGAEAPSHCHPLGPGLEF